MTPNLTKSQTDQLIKAALEARANSYAPYSQYNVGAALLLENGTIVKGANVENASYGLAICAERAAVTQAVNNGQQKFKAIAIATQSSPPGAPCGMCRQFLAEFAPDIPIILINPQGETTHTSLQAIFPMQFRLENVLPKRN